MSIQIEKAVLKKACMEMIETILFCLPHAFKGTIYSIGRSQKLIAERITSGIIDDDRKEISWGLPAKSEYNPPGKPWIAYRDEPGRPLEAMSWCVQKQKSWTAEDPANDIRNIRSQAQPGLEDFFHMEPVLVRKSDLNLDLYSPAEYPRDYEEKMIWGESEYIVVAVIKIHFRPNTIKINSNETRVIKKLSRSLGTELLSYQLRQDSLKAIQELANDRLNACNILSDSLRNAITKSGLIFSLVKQEIGHLRDQWEQLLARETHEENPKVEGVQSLNELLMGMDDIDHKLKEALLNAQERFLEISLPPAQGEKWVAMQIEERWNDLLQECPLDDGKKEIIRQAIDKLKKSLYFGQDVNIIKKYNSMQENVKKDWVDLLYQNNDRFSAPILDKLIKLLTDPELHVPFRSRSRKKLKHLKALAETMNQLERNTNFLLYQVLNGNGDERTSRH